MSSLFKTGRYLFHVHTALTDGDLSSLEYLYAARKYQLEIGFLEHIRKNPTYDPAEFIQGVRRGAARLNVSACVGFEVNVSDTGLNLPVEAAQRADMLGLAVHGYTGSPVELLMAYIANITRIRAINATVPIIWPHPGLWFAQRGYLVENTGYFHAMLLAVLRRGVMIELNRKYALPPRRFVDLVPPDQRIYGADTHTWADVKKYLASVT